MGDRVLASRAMSDEREEVRQPGTSSLKRTSDDHKDRPAHTGLEKTHSNCTPPRAPAAQPPPASSLELPPPLTSNWLERSWPGRGYLERGCLRARGNLDVGGTHELVVAVVAGLHLLAHDALLVLVARLRLVQARPRPRVRGGGRRGGGGGAQWGRRRRRGAGGRGKGGSQAQLTWIAMCVL